jgi:hypothetical protein
MKEEKEKKDNDVERQTERKGNKIANLKKTRMGIPGLY